MTDDNEHHDEEVKPAVSDWNMIPPLGTPHNPAADPEFTLPEDQRPPDPGVGAEPGVDAAPRSRRAAV